MNIVVYDLHASESGALAILDDFYQQVSTHDDKKINWTFIVSTPDYPDEENIKVIRYPWVKKNWLVRSVFELFSARRIILNQKPDIVFSLQNKGIHPISVKQVVYLHLPFVLTEHRFSIKKDGKRLWFYQNVLSRTIFSSLRKVERTIVQTQWMKDTLISKAKVQGDFIEILHPDISMNLQNKYIDDCQSRKCFFYPATAFTYKNHLTIVKATKALKEKGINDLKVIFTIEAEESELTNELFNYVKDHNLPIVFGGKMQREDVFDMYTRSSLLFPSYVESFGMPLLEARMTNTFVIAATTPYSKEILNGYRNAFFIETFDYKGMANHMEKIMNCTYDNKMDGMISIKQDKQTLIDLVMECGE